jgi:hypothetical protein
VGPRAALDAWEYRKVSYPCHELNKAYSTSVGRYTSVGIIGSLRVGRSEDRIPVWAKIFPIRPDQSWSLPSPLYDGYRVTTMDKEAGACL